MEDPRYQQNSRFSSLPIELHHDIFCRLPSKPLHICKCVSKAWYSIISSIDFTHFHSLHSRSSRLLVFNSFDRLSFLELDSSASEREPIIISNLNNTVVGGSLLTLVGTCNGLVCVWESLNERLYVYNPFTHHAWTIPTLEYSLMDGFYFGYDSVTDDYKIMRISRNEASVFSLRSWSWKRLDDFPYKLELLVASDFRTPCEFLDGYIHWVVKLNDNSCQCFDCNINFRIGIARFNVSNEEYSLMELPQVLSKGTGIVSGYIDLDVFDGCLCLQVMRYGSDESQRFDVWVMKEYGVNESWNRLFRIDYSPNSNVGFIKALTYSSTGDRVLVLRDFDYYWYDTKGKEIESASYKYRGDDGEPVTLFSSIVCAGRLTSPICGDKQLRQLALDDKLMVTTNWQEAESSFC